ncbi:ROK family protein [Sinobaca sp. H24]|uniref:ROK family protein n=1 Tax=Sinobaca sp. H24 TaxID=2923376 RepID=UPI0020797FFB|nr:ROK family protein [Sinobaca sp. H24]
MNDLLVFDIGGTYIKYGVLNESRDTSCIKKKSTPSSLKELIDFIADEARQAESIKGIAVSSPGAVSDEGIVYGSSALPYLHGPNIKQLIMESTGLAVYMENDANCAAYAELWGGAGKGKKDFLVMVIGTGIGGAVIKDKMLHKGANLHGGEFGYMLLNSDPEKNEVWSRVASTKALVKKVAGSKGMSEAHLTGKQVYEWASEGDCICLNAIDEFYHLLAVGIYNLQYIYDPEVILIGGGISAREEVSINIEKKIDLILEKVPLAKIKPIIRTCHYRQHANLLGAAYGFYQMKNYCNYMKFI